MNLFENEVINISGIKTVNMYDSDIEFTNNNVRHYDVNLSAYELIFFISGENETHFAGVDIHDVPDSLRFLPKGIPSGEYYVKKLKKGVCIDIYFDTLDSMPCVAMSLKNMNELNPLFFRIYNGLCRHVILIGVISCRAHRSADFYTLTCITLKNIE